MGAKENPGALAGATGTNQNSLWSWFDNNLKREADASKLVSALMNCSAQDRVSFLEIILDALAPDWRAVALIDDMQDARWWAASASDRQRKAMALASYEAMPEPARRSFVAYITGARHG